MVTQNDKDKMRELVSIIRTYGTIKHSALATKVDYSISKFNSLKPMLLLLHAEEVKYEAGLWRYIESKQETVIPQIE